jgi:hypothetical protein
LDHFSLSAPSSQEDRIECTNPPSPITIPAIKLLHKIRGKNSFSRNENFDILRISQVEDT